MYARVQYAEYLDEARKQVCSRCPERTDGRGPLTRRCRHCGVELQLPQLVEAIHAADIQVTDPGPTQVYGSLCARCAHQGDGICPCQVRSLSSLLVQAVRNVDERQRQRYMLQRYLARQYHKDKVPVAEMIRAYEAATGSCVACD